VSCATEASDFEQATEVRAPDLAATS
jgi:hypothetical protein